MKQTTRKIILLLFISHCTLQIAVAQQPTLEWVRRYSPGANLSASGLFVKQDTTGSVYVLVRQGSDSTYGDYGLLKYSPGGNLLWSVKYDSPGNLDETPKAFDVSKAGDVYITGSSGINFEYPILTVKFNSNGILQWARGFDGGYSDVVNDIKIDRIGNIVICGGSSVNNNTSYALAIKYNSSGDSLWVRKNTQYQYSYTGNLLIDDSANVYTAGVHQVNMIQSNYLILKYSSNGNLVWFSSYGVTGYAASAYSLAIDSNRNVYAVGVLNVPQPGFWDNVLIKINQNGVLQWARNYTGINNNHSCSASPVGLSVTPNGDDIYYATHIGNGQGGGAKDIVTLKYNSSGDSIWVRRYNGGVFASANVPVTLKLDQYNNAYITGYADYTATGTDYVTIKYLPNGIQQWVTTYNGYNSFIDNANELSVDSSNIYVTGTSRNITDNSTDAVTIKYNQVIGIISNNNELPTQFKLYQNYPNPFNPITIINYEIPVKSYVQLNLYNLLGQKVKILVEKEHQPSYYTIILNAEGISSGIYFYTLISDNKRIDSKKLIIVK